MFQKITEYSGTFVQKFITEHFQKSPNLVTLYTFNWVRFHMLSVLKVVLNCSNF